MQDKKQLPKFSQPGGEARIIEGVRVGFIRLDPATWIDVASRLFAEVGESVAKILCSPDQQLDPEIERAMTEMLMAAGLSKEEVARRGVRFIKQIILSSVLGKIKDLDLGWYFENLVVGSLTLDGVLVESMSDLREAAPGPASILQIFKFALEFHVFPTLDALGTNLGVQSPTSHSQDESRIRGKSRSRGATSKAGRKDPTLQSTG